jgi:hypothetical protein
MLEQLRADSDLVSSLETGVAETAMSDEEKQILEEFEQAAKTQAETQPSEPPRQIEQEEPAKQEQPPEPEA